jgi:hypothetical protein
MPIEPPTPTGKTLDTLCAALAELQAASKAAPNDARLAAAVLGLAGVVGVLRAMMVEPPERKDA